jgi:serine/threonine protein phosphatase PrpC
MFLNINVYGLSDIGMERKTNQDAFKYDASKGVFAVADGIGGLSHGEVASQLAVDGFLKKSESSDLCKDEDWGVAFDAINAAIFEKSVELQSYGQMGTTLTCAKIVGKTLFFGHLGDSALYHFRAKDGLYEMQRLTEEHTLMGEFLLMNGPTEDFFYLPSFYQHTLTRCLGVAMGMDVQCGQIELERGDRLLLVTDGVLLGVTEGHMAELVSKNDSPKALVEQLIECANLAGGQDNSTAVAVYL